MRSRVAPLLRLVAAVVVASCSRSVEPVVECKAEGAARPVCIFQNPEDLAALPGGEALVVSEYGAMEGGRSGALVLFVLATDERRVLFRGGDAAGRPALGWGDPSCPGPPPAEFSPHGIDLAVRPDGSLALAAVQHGGRESIELFEVTGAGRDWKLQWRGCVIPPEDSWLNEVVLLSDGSLLATHMASREAGIDALLDAEGDTGYALQWIPGQGFSKVPGTDGGLVNGIEVSADERVIFLNVTYGGEVRRVDRATGRTQASAPVTNPDNSTWAPDGMLLVASLQAEDLQDFQRCQRFERGGCPIPFAIIAVDPGTMESSVRYRSDGSPMGAGTVGLQVGDELFVGSFAGDRILRVDLGGGRRFR